MSFYDKLERLRAAPEARRRRFAFLAALSVTLVVAALWATSLNFTLFRPSGNAQVATVKVGVATSTGPWEVNKNKIITGWQTLTNQNK